MADSRSREIVLASIRDLLVARRKSGHIWRPLPDHVRDTVLAMIHHGVTVNQIVRATNINFLGSGTASNSLNFLRPNQLAERLATIWGMGSGTSCNSLNFQGPNQLAESEMGSGTSSN